VNVSKVVKSVSALAGSKFELFILIDFIALNHLFHVRTSLVPTCAIGCGASADYIHILE
jgi:hypothetical protein